jgi:hypothetical protein
MGKYVGEGVRSPLKHVYLTKFGFGWAGLFAIALALLMLFVGITVIGVHVFAIAKVFAEPIKPNWVSYCVGGVGALGALVNLLGLCISTIPLPYSDYRLVLELSELKKIDEAEYWARIDELKRKS